MPTPKKGLSVLARAQLGLGAKQIRRSVQEYSAKKDQVFQKLRNLSLPKQPAPAKAEAKEPPSDNPPPQ